jgi:predicted ATPase with chaperone activity
VVGLDGALVEVEVDLANGLPAFTIVGLPDAAVNEAKERVRAAIRNSGLSFPKRRPICTFQIVSESVTPSCNQTALDQLPF